MNRTALLTTCIFAATALADDLADSLTAADRSQLAAWRIQGPAAVPAMVKAVTCDMSRDALAQAAIGEWVRMGAAGLAALMAAPPRNFCGEGATSDRLIVEVICRMPGDMRALQAALAPALAGKPAPRGLELLERTTGACPTNAALASLTVPLLAAELDSGRPGSDRALFALGQLGPLAARATPALVHRLERRQPEDDSNVIAGLLKTLASIGPGAAAALPTLRGLVAPPSVELRGNAAAAIAAIGPGTTVGVSELLKLLAESLVGPADAPCRLPFFGAAANVAKAIRALPPAGWQLSRVLEVLHRSESTPRECLPYRERAVLGALVVLGPELAGDSNESSWARAVLRSSEAPPGNRTLAAEVLVAMGRVDATDQPFLDALERKKALHTSGNREAFVFFPQTTNSPLGLLELSEALQICRAEAKQPPFESWAVLEKQLSRDVDQGNSDAAACLEAHLCGPDVARLQATIATCCTKSFPARRPAWCQAAAK